MVERTTDIVFAGINDSSAVPWLEHCPWGCDLQICRVNVEFTRVSEAAENEGTKCRRQTAGGPGGRYTAPRKF